MILTGPCLNTIFQVLQSLPQPHIDAFNDVVDGGLTKALSSLPPLEYALPDGTKIALRVLVSQSRDVC